MINGTGMSYFKKWRNVAVRRTGPEFGPMLELVSSVDLRGL